MKTLNRISSIILLVVTGLLFGCSGEWNDVEIIVFKGTVIHKQNGVVVVEYHLWTPEWDEMIAGSKFPSYNKNWAKIAPKGYIALQDHGDDVWFKDLL